jgi:hypothetical protein
MEKLTDIFSTFSARVGLPTTTTSSTTSQSCHTHPCSSCPPPIRESAGSGLWIESHFSERRLSDKMFDYRPFDIVNRSLSPYVGQMAFDQKWWNLRNDFCLCIFTVHLKRLIFVIFLINFEPLF